MGKQRCLNCYIIKDAQYFSVNRNYCDSCVHKRKVNCTRCGTSVVTSTGSNNTLCQKCLKQIDSIKSINKNTLNHIKASSVKVRLMNEIIQMVDELGIEEIPGFDDIDFTNISVSQLKNLRKDELLLLLDNINEICDERNEVDIEDTLYVFEPELIDPLEIIRKYRALLDNKLQKNKLVEQWRLNIPKSIKDKIKNWKSESIQSIYDQLKELMKKSSGKGKEEIMDFVCDLSEIIFEKQVPERIPIDDIGRVEDWVMSRVEIIILPQLEVLDLFENEQVKLFFDDSWTSELTETLKKEVLKRDGGQCFICNNKYKLVLHQIISTATDKFYHNENLITLCHSCEDAVNTRNVNKAFKQCLKNFIEYY